MGSNNFIQQSLSRVFIPIVLNVCFYVKAHINSHCEVCQQLSRGSWLLQTWAPCVLLFCRMQLCIEGLSAACTSLQRAHAFTYNMENFKINYLYQFFTKSHKNEFVIFTKRTSFSSYNVSITAPLYDPCKARIRQN